MKKTNKTEVTVVVDADDIQRHLEERIAFSVQALFADAVKVQVAGRVKTLIDEFSANEIKKAVTEAIEDGWPTTNTYGEAVGPKVGLKGRIAAMLSKEEGDYNRRVTRVDKIASEAIDAALRDQFGKELVAARERFKAQLDALIAAKFTESIKSALGLK